MTKRKVRTVTVIWGREFVELFLQTAARSLLAHGNLPELAARHEVIFAIFTTADDAKLLEASAVFRRLRSVVNVHWSLFEPAEIDVTNYGSHVRLWEQGLETARRNREILFFLPPDLIYADGTLTSWIRRFDDGARMVFMPGVQVVLETVLPELARRFTGDAVVSLGREELMDLLFRHFHPLHAAMRRGSVRRPPHPEYDIRLLPQKGIVIREIVSHPFCLDAGFFAKFSFFVPDDHLEASAFEPCSAVSVEPLLKRINLYYRPSPLTEAKLSNLGSWYRFFGNRACEFESRFPYVLPLKGASPEATTVEQAASAGMAYRASVVVAGTAYALFEGLRAHGLSRAAQFLAFAIYAGRARRRVALRPNATLLVPTDTALSEPGTAARLDKLMIPGREQDFVDLVRDHIVARKHHRALNRRGNSPSPGQGSLLTQRGLPAEHLAASAKIVGPTFRVGSLTVIAIDRVLWRDTEQDEAQGQQPADIPVERIFALSKWAKTSPLHRFVFYTLHVPFLEPIIAVFVPVYFLRDPRKPWRRIGVGRLIRSIVAVSRPIPVLGRIVDIAVRLVRSTVRNGFLVTMERVFNRLPGRAARRLAYCARVWHQHGFASLVSRVRARVRATSAPMLAAITAGGRPPPHDLQSLNDIRLLRAVQAVGEVLSDFYADLEMAESTSLPVQLSRALIETVEPGRSLSEVVEQRLRLLVSAHGEWAEAWLELGFLMQDEGRSADALTAFQKAMQSVRYSDNAPGNRDPRAIAAAELGRLHLAAGRIGDACTSFDFALVHDAEQRIMAVEYAHALRRNGARAKALDMYAIGMMNEETRWTLPPLPRDARRLLPDMSADLGRHIPTADCPINATTPRDVTHNSTIHAL